MHAIQIVRRGYSLALFVLAAVALVPLAAHADNLPPSPPSNPAPADGDSLTLLHVTLSWQATDPDLADPEADEYLTFDLYFGDSPSPPLFSSGNYMASYGFSGLSLGTQYYWKVVVHDNYGHETEGPVWTFFTRAANQPPAPPFNGSPANNSLFVMAAFGQLSWQCSDPDGDTVKYDVYFGTTSPPPLAKAKAGSKSYDPGMLEFVTTYYWKIIARDEAGAASSGPLWKFTTKANTAPRAPHAPTPANARPGQPINAILSWQCTDDDFEPLKYDVYFGTASSPPLVATDVPDVPYPPTYAPGTLAHSTLYYWKIVAHDKSGLTSTSATWYFKTIDGPLPVAFSRFDAVAREAGIEVQWELVSDETMESYTVYRHAGTDARPIAIAEGSVTATRGSYLDRTVEAGKTYEYEMVVRTQGGDEYRSQRATVETRALALQLGPNHPNPFNPQTTIPYIVPETATPVHVRLTIYDASGRPVRVLVNENESSGSREAVWNGDDAAGNVVSSGIYFCVLEVGKERRTQKLVLLK